MNKVFCLLTLSIMALLLSAACTSDKSVDPLDRLSLPGDYLGVYSYYCDGVSEPISMPVECRFSSDGYCIWRDLDRDTCETSILCDANGAYDTAGGITFHTPQVVGILMCDSSLSPKGDFRPWLQGDTLVLFQPSFAELDDVPVFLQGVRKKALIARGPDSGIKLRRKLVLWPDEEPTR